MVYCDGKLKENLNNSVLLKGILLQQTTLSTGYRRDKPLGMLGERSKSF